VADGTRVVARSTISTTGVEYCGLNLPVEDRLLAAGVYHGARGSEATLCRGDEDVFVGGRELGGLGGIHFFRVTSRQSSSWCASPR
jgi:thioredoxin reductase (NADPH)